MNFGLLFKVMDNVKNIDVMAFIQNIPMPKILADQGMNFRYFYLFVTGLMLFYVCRRIFVLI